MHIFWQQEATIIVMGRRQAILFFFFYIHVNEEFIHRTGHKHTHTQTLVLAKKKSHLFFLQQCFPEKWMQALFYNVTACFKGVALNVSQPTITAVESLQGV